MGLGLFHGQNDLARSPPALPEESIGAELARRVVVGKNYAAMVGVVWAVTWCPTPPTSPLMTPDQTSDALGMSLTELQIMRCGTAGPNYHGIGLGLVRYNTADVMRWRTSRTVS